MPIGSYNKSVSATGVSSTKFSFTKNIEKYIGSAANADGRIAETDIMDFETKTPEIYARKTKTKLKITDVKDTNTGAEIFTDFISFVKAMLEPENVAKVGMAISEVISDAIDLVGIRGKERQNEVKYEQMRNRLSVEERIAMDLYESSLVLKYDCKVEDYKYFSSRIRVPGAEGEVDIMYEGRCLSFEVDFGKFVYAPLAIATYQNGEVVWVPMTPEQEEAFTAVTRIYYNRIMDQVQNSYSKEYADTIKEHVKMLTFIYADFEETEGEWAGLCWSIPNSRGDSAISLRIDQIYDFDYGACPGTYNYQIGAFTHECGHSYDQSSGEWFSSSEEWNQIYEQLCREDSIAREVFRDYTFSNLKECFADICMFYFHHPELVKQVDIDIPGYDNLYDYMKDLIGER